MITFLVFLGLFLWSVLGAVAFHGANPRKSEPHEAQKVSLGKKFIALLVLFCGGPIIWCFFFILFLRATINKF